MKKAIFIRGWSIWSIRKKGSHSYNGNILPFIFFIPCLLALNIASAQQLPERVIADSLYVQAGEFAAAATLYRQLAERWEKLGQKDSAFRNYFFQAKALSQLSEWESALTICESLTLPVWADYGHTHTVDLYFEIGYIQANLGNIKAAIVSYDRALMEEGGADLVDSIKLADIQQFKGVALMYDGQPEEALSLATEAHQIRLRHWPQDTLALAYSANNLNLLYSERYQYEKADYYVAEAVRIAKLRLPPTHPHIAFLLNNYSTSRRNMGDPLGARMLLLEAVEANKASNNAYNLAMNYYSLGNLYTDLREFDQAQTYFTYAFQIGDTLFANPSQNRANIHDGMARIAIYQKRFEEAESYLKLGLAQKRQLGDKESLEVARTHNSLGTVAMETHAWETALAYFEKSFQLRLPKLGANHPLTLESRSGMASCLWELNHAPQSLEIWKDCLLKLRQGQKTSFQGITELSLCLAEAYGELGQVDSLQTYLKVSWSSIMGLEKPIQHWNEFAQYDIVQLNPIVFDLILFHLTQLREQAGLEVEENVFICEQMVEKLSDFLPRFLPLIVYQNMQNELAQSLQQIYASTALIVHRGAGLQAPQKQEFLLSCLENSKAFSIRIALQNRSAIQFANLPDSILQQDRQLRARIWSMYSLKESDSSPSQAALLKEDLILKNEWSIWQKKLAQVYPKYHQLLYEKTPFDFQTVQKDLLDEKESILAYLQIDSIMLAMTFDGERMFTVELPFSTSFQDSLLLFNRLIAQRAAKEQIAHLGHQVYQALFAPLASRITPKLIIFPDELLHQINFELLVSAPPEAGQFSWLVNTYEIRYANHLHKTETDFAYGQDHLIIAPGFSAEVKQAYLSQIQAGQIVDSVFLQWLSTPWSEKLAQKLAGKGWTTALLGAEASQKNLSASVEKANILHFATHAVVNDSVPLNSFLALYPDPTGSNDGFLFAHELYGISLKAPLAILAACQSGRGTYQKGEGVLSLAHAFQFAGCPNLLYSLWSIDDQQSNLLMEDFYQQIDRGQSISAALRQAKLNYLETYRGEFSHPYYWGGLVLLGDNLTIKKSFWDASKWAYLAGFLWFILIVAYFLKKNRKS